MAPFSTLGHRMLRESRWIPEEDAVRVSDRVWTSHGVTDSHLVTTSAGDVVINTGFASHGARHRERYEQGLGRAAVQVLHHQGVGAVGGAGVVGVAAHLHRRALAMLDVGEAILARDDEAVALGEAARRLEQLAGGGLPHVDVGGIAFLPVAEEGQALRVRQPARLVGQ